jgi:hypothetical protein
MATRDRKHEAVRWMMDRLTFGVEIEIEGINKASAVAAIRAALGGEPLYAMGVAYGVRMSGRREWTVTHDGSLVDGCEVVSPICTTADIPRVQEVVRALRRAGAQVSERCGLHVHVGGIERDDAGAKMIARLAASVYRYEPVIEKAVGRPGNRYCRPMAPEFADYIWRHGSRVTRYQLEGAWYGRYLGSPSRYDTSRYHGLNLNSWFYRGTVEFRYFASTLHAGRVRAMITLCLALVAHAVTAKHVSGRLVDADASDRELMRRLVKLTLGIDDQTVLEHLMSRLPKRAATRQAAVEQPAEVACA